MTRDEADQLVYRMLAYWGKDPSRRTMDIWFELLTDLDTGKANTTLAKLKTGTKDQPTPQTFHELYQGLDTSRPEDKCNTCRGAGWIESGFQHHPWHWPGPVESCPPAWERVITNKDGTTRLAKGCDCNVAMVCPTCKDNKAQKAHAEIGRLRNVQ